MLDLHSMVEEAAPRSHHRATVILGRGAWDSWTAVGLAVTEAVRVQKLGGNDPVDLSSGLMSYADESEGEQIRVVDTRAFFEDGWWGEGDGDE